jgi:hypothetical protein
MHETTRRSALQAALGALPLASFDWPVSQMWCEAGPETAYSRLRGGRSVAATTAPASASIPNAE